MSDSINWGESRDFASATVDFDYGMRSLEQERYHDAVKSLERVGGYISSWTPHVSKWACKADSRTISDAVLAFQNALTSLSNKEIPQALGYFQKVRNSFFIFYPEQRIIQIDILSAYKHFNEGDFQKTTYHLVQLEKRLRKLHQGFPKNETIAAMINLSDTLKEKLLFRSQEKSTDKYSQLHELFEQLFLG